jgi:hypothetical protein
VSVGLSEVAQALRDGVNATADIGLSQIQADVDAHLNDIRIKELAPVRADLAITDLPIVRTESTANVDLGLDDIRIRELAPVRVELAFKPVRVHLPMNYSFCIELFGVRLFKFSLCGEGMVIAEDYRPRASERC